MPPPDRRPSTRQIVAQDAPAENLTTDRLSNTSQTILQQQEEEHGKKRKKRRTLYFAYGSNLSPTQMHLRCEHDPSISARPIALARLDHWRWLICERGYANVIPPVDWRIGRQVGYADTVPESTTTESAGISAAAAAAAATAATSAEEEKDVVFGILYEMTPEDEYLLDGYEGVDHTAPASVFAHQIDTHVRPREQENGAYNKWYVPARVVKWFVDEKERSEYRDDNNDVTVLVYVDEKRVSLGPPKYEYIARMNRAIAEGVELGIPPDWVRSVMRRAIPVGS